MRVTSSGRIVRSEKGEGRRERGEGRGEKGEGIAESEIVNHQSSTPNSGSELIARDSRALFGSTGLAVAGQAVAIVVGLACTIVTIRLLDLAAYGRFALFFMFLEIISHLLAWPNLGLVRFGREEMGAARASQSSIGRLAETFWARMVLFLVSVLAAAGLLWALRQPLENYLKLEFAIHILLLLYVALNGFVLLARSVFQTVTQFRAYALALASVKILNLALIVTVFILLRRPVGPGRIIALHIVSFGVVCLICLFLLPWKSLLPVRVKLPAIGRMASYSWPLLPAGLSALVVNWVDFALIKHYALEASVGLYAAAYQPVTVLIALKVALISAVIPLLVSLATEKRSETLTWYLDDALGQIAWALGLGSVLLAIGAEAIPLLLGQKYLPSIVPCQVLMAGAAFFIFTSFQSALAKALDRVRAVFAVGLLTALLNTLFDLALVPRFGIRGAGIATTAAFILSGLFYFPILNSERSLRGSSPLRRYGAILGLAAPFIMAGVALMADTRIMRVGCGLGIVAVWGVMARMTGVFRTSTLEKWRSVHMPNWARRAIGTFYAVLGR